MKKGNMLLRRYHDKSTKEEPTVEELKKTTKPRKTKIEGKEA